MQPIYARHLVLPAGLEVRFHRAGETFKDPETGDGWCCVRGGDPGLWEIGYYADGRIATE